MKSIKIKALVIIGVVALVMACNVGNGKVEQEIRDAFDMGLSSWVVEDESDSAVFEFHHDTLFIKSPAGLTLWYNRKLSGEYQISYFISLQIEGGGRLSDMNCFWAATDPLNPDDFFARSGWRHGIFSRYNSLNMYYVGYGGNNNTTTRFRKYYGKYYNVDNNKIKPLIQEYIDAEHLLQPNRWYKVIITVAKGKTSFEVNGERLFELMDKELYSDGYFGIRLLSNRAAITGFTIHYL